MEPFAEVEQWCYANEDDPIAAPMFVVLNSYEKLFEERKQFERSVRTAAGLKKRGNVLRLLEEQRREMDRMRTGLNEKEPAR